MPNAVFTIVARNYFAYAKTLAQSVSRSNPDVDFHVLVVDARDVAFEQQNPGYRLTWVEDLPIRDFRHLAFKYDILELNTNVKPTFAKELLKRYERVVYLDPDIQVFDSLDTIFRHLEQHPVVLTPHITSPIDDDLLPGETEFLTSGVYNLGFIGFNGSNAALRLLDWWEKRCLHLAYDDKPQGLFVDQKWMDFAPSLCENALILRDCGYNVAYWNLHERQLSRVGDEYVVNGRAPLAFFHFSGLPSHGDGISKYQNRYTLAARPDLAPLFADYRAALEANGHAGYLKLPYGFGAFSNGVAVSRVARRAASATRLFASVPDPFDAEQPLYRALVRHRLVHPSGAAAPNPHGVSDTDRKHVTRVIHWVFGRLLRFVGPARYERLMRHLGTAASLRKQAFLLNETAR